MRAWTGRVLAGALAVAVARAGTLTYSYDEQHRLSGVNYDNRATATYGYDEASNLTEFTVLTDSDYFRPFMIYFTLVEPTPDGGWAPGVRWSMGMVDG